MNFSKTLIFFLLVFPNLAFTSEGADCPLGQGSGDNGSCFDCKEGNYSKKYEFKTYAARGGIVNVVDSVCVPCPSGMSSPAKSTSSSACTACPLGKYQPMDPQVGWGKNNYLICLPCPWGKYADQIGLAQCKNCPAGTGHKLNGSKSAADCVKCPVGTYSLGGGTECKKCPEPYLPNKSQTGCTREAGY